MTSNQEKGSLQRHKNAAPRQAHATSNYVTKPIWKPSTNLYKTKCPFKVTVRTKLTTNLHTTLSIALTRGF